MEKSDVKRYELLALDCQYMVTIGGTNNPGLMMIPQNILCLHQLNRLNLTCQVQHLLVNGLEKRTLSESDMSVR